MMGVPSCFRSSGATMPSAGTLCQLLALGLLVETRLELAAQTRDSPTRRVLGDDAPIVVTEPREMNCSCPFEYAA